MANVVDFLFTMILMLGAVGFGVVVFVILDLWQRR